MLYLVIVRISDISEKSFSFNRYKRINIYACVYRITGLIRKFVCFLIVYLKKNKKDIILIELKELLKRATIYGSIVRIYIYIYIRLHVKKSFVFIL